MSNYTEYVLNRNTKELHQVIISDDRRRFSQEQCNLDSVNEEDQGDEAWARMLLTDGTADRCGHCNPLPVTA